MVVKDEMPMTYYSTMTFVDLFKLTDWRPIIREGHEAFSGFWDIKGHHHHPTLWRFLTLCLDFISVAHNHP